MSKVVDCGSRGQHDRTRDHAHARAFLETCSAPSGRLEQFLASRGQMENEGVLETRTEAGGRPGDVDRAVVRRDRYSSGSLATPGGKLLVE